MLIAGRGAQGLGAALLSPAILSIIMVTFADGPERRRALGVFGVMNAAGFATGLLLSGILTEVLSWRWIFFINVPIGLVLAPLTLLFVPTSRAERRPETVDFLGALTVTAGLLVLVYAIVNAQEWGWESTKTIGVFAGAIALLTAFVVVELLSREPLMRLSIFARRSLSAANLAMFLFGAGMLVMMFFPTLYLQRVLQYTPIETGVAFFPLTLSIAAAAAIGQRLMRRFGVRSAVISGLVLCGISLYLFSGMSVPGSYVDDYLPGLIAGAAGFGLTTPALILIATTKVEGDEAGLASGIINTSQFVGGALGLAVLSSIASNRTASILAGLGREPTPLDQLQAMVDGFERGYLGGLVLIVAAIALVLILLRRSDVAELDAWEQMQPVPAVEAELAPAPEGAGEL